MSSVFRLVAFVSVVPMVLLSTLRVDAQQISFLEHESVNAASSSLVQVDADTYALAYEGADNDGFIKTFTISADGTSIVEVSSLEHETDYASSNSLVQVDTDTYALAHVGPDGHGFITTFDISADGTTITEISSLEHETSNGTHNSLVQVDADTYALAYSGTNTDGFITTFDISADGTTITEISSLEHDTGQGAYNSLIQVDTDTYALAYSGDGDDGYITTFTISADGTSITEVASLEHDIAYASANSLFQVDADTFALAYRGPDNDGFIKTFTIPADGSSITEVFSLEHDPVSANGNSLVQVDSDTIALAYSGSGLDGFIKTFEIPADGSSITEISSLEHDPLRGSGNSLVHVVGNTYALAYTDNGFDGIIKTFDITDIVPITLMSFSAD